MEFQALIRSRQSVRAYTPEPVPDPVLQRILEAGRLAPTAANRQAFGIVVARTEGREEELGRLYRRAWFIQAPLVLAVCALPARAWRHEDGTSMAMVDAAIVMDHLILAAADEGLGTCWIAHFNKTEARKAFDLPDDVEPVVLTPLGHPADSPRPKKRKPLEELVHHERWSPDIL